jgi:K+-transporting ATPase KdpF subunit
MIEKIMKSKIGLPLIFLTIVPPHASGAASGGHLSYIIGGIIALLILGYLIYTLMHPEKF